MSLLDPNARSKTDPKRIAIVLSNPAVSPTTKDKVGFWWSELTHPWFAFAEAGMEAEVFSYAGGRCEADAMSDPRDPSGYSSSDLISMGFIHTPALAALVEDTRPVSAIDPERFDAILIAGGQAPMVTMQDAHDLHRLFVDFHARGKIACCLCHGSSILAYATLPDGTPLAKGRTVTGFANVEEDFADEAVWSYGILPRGTHLMPWRIEDRLKDMGANYVQAGLWRAFAIRDGNLVTGQQNSRAARARGW
jgi:putative intracellular protease/amidase